MRKKTKSDVKSIDDWASEQMSAYEVSVFEDFCRDCGYSAEQLVEKPEFDNLLKLHEERKSY